MADLALSGPLYVSAGKVLEDMRASARAARREMKELNGSGEGGVAKGAGAIVDALDYVLYQVSHVLQL